MEAESEVREGPTVTSVKQRDLPSPAPLHFSLQSVHLGTDQDGDAVTSAVVIPADAPTPRRKPLTGKTEVAMQALHDAIRDHGEAVEGRDYPHNRKAVKTGRWRHAFGQHGLSGDGTSPDAARKAFSRAKEKLIDENYIREFNDLVWVVADED